MRQRLSILLSTLVLITASILGRDGPASAAEFDLVILGSRIVDGTGNPWFEADIGITGSKIVEIGRIDPSRAAEKVYARGLVVAPGFIDVHTHIESGIEKNPNAENFLMMGVTSVVTGNCGSSAINLDEWFTRIGQKGIGVNVACWGASTASIRLVEEARARGVQVTVDQYLYPASSAGIGILLRKMSEEDVERIFRQPFTMVASDAGIISPEEKSVPHPRGFGNNARALALYARERKIVSLPEAIRRMTSLPAQTFKIWDRGLIRQGMAADLVVFDEKAIRDLATFENPKQSPIGVEYVILNGRKVIERGQYTHTNAGVILRGAGTKPDFSASTQSAEQTLRVRDELIYRRFYRLKRERQANLIDRRQYLDALRALRTDELKLFEDARNTQFDDLTEHEYWHRGRLKFPSLVAQEIALLEEGRQ